MRTVPGGKALVLLCTIFFVSLHEVRSDQWLANALKAVIDLYDQTTGKQSTLGTGLQRNVVNNTNTINEGPFQFSPKPEDVGSALTVALPDGSFRMSFLGVLAPYCNNVCVETVKNQTVALGCDDFTVYPKLLMFRAMCKVSDPSLTLSQMLKLDFLSMLGQDKAVGVFPGNWLDTVPIIDTSSYGTSQFVSPEAKAAATPTSPPLSTGSKTIPWGLLRIKNVKGISGTDSTVDKFPAQGNNTEIYIVDTGCRVTHEQFQGRRIRAMPAPNSQYTTGIDDYGHGSHVAGTAAGNTMGMARSSSIICIKALNSNGGGMMSDIVSGLDYVIGEKQKRPATPMVINLSIGGPIDTKLNAAITAAVKVYNIAVVAAAGNNGKSVLSYSPSSAGDAIVVTATGTNDRIGGFANSGPTVDLAAPGIDTYSCYHTADTAYAKLTGTSMATPLVAGSMALAMAEEYAIHKKICSPPDHFMSKIRSDYKALNVNGWGGSPYSMLFVGGSAQWEDTGSCSVGKPTAQQPTPAPTKAQIDTNINDFWAKYFQNFNWGK